MIIPTKLVALTSKSDIRAVRVKYMHPSFGKFANPCCIYVYSMNTYMTIFYVNKYVLSSKNCLISYMIMWTLDRLIQWSLTHICVISFMEDHVI